jgi:hypothetical protein
VAELEAKTLSDILVVKVQIDSADAWVRIDTGSLFNDINPQLAATQKLEEFRQTGGVTVVIKDPKGKSRHIVKVPELTVGDMKAKNLPFVVMDAAASGGLNADGILGAQFLAAFDVELDVPHGKVNLFTHDHCKGHVVYWTQDYSAVPFTTDPTMRPVLSVTLDGHVLKAELDTGAPFSILPAQVARRVFDIEPDENGRQPEGQANYGVGNTTPVYSHRFEKFEIGSITFHNTEFKVIRDLQGKVFGLAPPGEHVSSPVTIGMHHLSKLRAFIAYSEHTIYLSAADAN